MRRHEHRFYPSKGSLHVLSLLHSALFACMLARVNVLPLCTIPRGGGCVRTPAPGQPGVRAVDQAALTALAKFHHFPTIVLEYRRLSAICDATIKRLELPLRFCSLVGQHRLVPTVDFRSSTGRLKFMAPCLQNIPKEIPVTVRQRRSAPPVAPKPPPSLPHPIILSLLPSCPA